MRQRLKYFLICFCCVLLTGTQGQVIAAENDKAAKDKELKLYIAAKEGKLSHVKAMLADGVSVNAKNSSGRTALMSAAYYGNKMVVRELIVEGVDVNQVDEQGKTALMMAVANQKLEVVEELLNAGADAKLEDKNKNTALKIAEKLKNKKLTKLLESATE